MAELPFIKKIITTLLVCISLNALANSGKPVFLIKKSLPDTTVLPQILSLPLSSYIGKPVDSLLSVLPSNYSFRGFMPERIRFNRGVVQSYGEIPANDVTIQIYIDHYSYMSFPDNTRSVPWDMNLAKKETISFIKIIKNSKVCVYGCDNPNYDH